MTRFIKAILVYFTREAVVKTVFSFLIKYMSGIGLGPWLAKHIAEKLAEEVAIPVTKYTVNMGGYYYNRIEGRTYIGKLKDAEENNDEDAYDSTVGDILN